jgi:DNA-binding SARP family transcriptional activator/tetratricopeptide (TPR) repeat protein
LLTAGAARQEAADVVPVLRLLGPMALAGRNGQSVGPPRQRLVLAVLAVDAGRPVPVDRLIERVWGSDPPTQAHRTLHAYIARTRRILQQLPARIEWRDRAYLLCVEPQAVDLHRFRSLVAAAAATDCPPRRRCELLSEAAGLWHGQPLAGLDGTWVERTREAWQRELAAAVVAWAEAELDGGDPAAVLDVLTDLAGEQPLFEPLAAVTIRVLARIGRIPDALQLYKTIRTRLIEELGADPGAELQRAHEVALRGDDEPSAAPARPAQLPLSPAVFAGRHREIEDLDALSIAAISGRSTVVAVLSGSAGVGKSALAVHWAHRAAAQFPDGQLFVDLRAFGPDRQVVPATEAIRLFLEALGVAPERIPADLDRQTPLYRSRLAGRRMLLVLDNARDPAQVRPLLPGTPGYFVLVTSRNQLNGLLAGDGARPIPVGLLAPHEAVELLARRLGTGRVDAEPPAVREIVQRCGRLPLALAVVAARAATRPQRPLAAVAKSLALGTDRLDALADAADPATDVRSVFSWSYEQLPAAAAGLFRFLGLAGGPHVSVAAATSLAGPPVSVDAVRSRLAVLVDASLLIESLADQYTIHDLLREYAADLARRTDTETERAAALQRLTDHYLHSARAADRMLHAARTTAAFTAPSAGVVVEEFADHQAAMAWFDAERAALLDAVDRAATHGLDTHVVRLAWVLSDYLQRRGEWESLTRIHCAARAAALRQHDIPAQVEALRYLARAATRRHRFADAHAHLLAALELTTGIGDRAEQARTHHNLAILLDRQDRSAEALEHVGKALDLYRAIGDQRGQAVMLNAFGWCHSRLGDHTTGLAACQEALTLLQSIGEPAAEADTWDSLGHALHRLGRHTEAIDHYQQAIRLYQELEHQYKEANTLTRLGDVHEAQGDQSSAHDAWHLALSILTELDHPNAAAVQGRIRAGLRGEIRARQPGATR